jgi:ABC-type transporter Mla subunit MlaD
MPSPDKATIKADALGDLVASLDATMRAANDNRTAMRASVDTLERVLERFRGYRDRIDAALDDGTFPPDSRDAVLAVFGDLVRMTDQLRAQVAKAHGEQGPFLAGMAKARQLADHHRRLQQQAAARAADDDAEEDAYRDDLAARRQGNSNAPPDQAAVAEDARGAAEDAQGADPTQDTPDAQDSPEGPAEDASEPAACSHCGDAMTADTGSGQCVACVSHRNRYGKLPSERALANRRKRADP